MSSYFANFQKYDGKGRRVSIFGTRNGNSVEIFVLTCSKKDQFCKSCGHEVYKKYLETGKVVDGYHPQVFKMAFNPDEMSARAAFNEYCWDNYKSVIEQDFAIGIPSDRILSRKVHNTGFTKFLTIKTLV